MKKTDFNKGWTCRCLTRDEAEYPVTLPHDAMISEPRTEASRGEGNIGWFIAGDYEYRKSFSLPESETGKKLLLEFEGVYRNAEVYLNGNQEAFRPYGYTNFYVDLTGKLYTDKENELRVIARNDEQPNSRWYSGTGIYRPVTLWSGEEKHIPVNGVRIKTLKSNPAVIEVRVKTSADGPVDLQIFDQGEEILKRSVQSQDGEAVTVIELPGAKVWNVETPNLYTCRVTYENDVVEETFGIRTISYDPLTGFAINGRRVILRGACIHHDNGILGACAFPEAEERKVRILKENGYNAIRSAHNPCSKALLDACDRLGMLMLDEYADCWYIHKTEHDYVTYLMDWWEQDLADMVDKDFNHPSVVMYATGNEVSETAQERGIAFTKQLTDRLHELDGTRPVTCGVNIFFNFLSSIGLGVYSDDKAKKNAEAAAKKTESDSKKPKKKAVGSEFYNMMAVTLGDEFMKRGATIYPCDVKTRDAFANMDIAGYNYGIYRYKHDLKKYPNRLILGSETFYRDGYLFYELAKENPRIVGDFVWSGIDYIGETGLGCQEYSDYKHSLRAGEATQITGENGRIDLLGKPRSDAAYTKVAFELEKGPFMAVFPVYQKEKLKTNGWQSGKALESWSWRGCAGNNAKIEVFARATIIELFLNGRSVGKKGVPTKSIVTTFTVPYEDGELMAVAYDAEGNEIGRQTMRTADVGTVLRVMPERTSVKPEELVFIPIRYTDENGTWQPMEKHKLTVTVENGTLVGLGNANGYFEGNYTADTTKTYYGEAMAVVRAGAEGTVKVNVYDEERMETAEILCAAEV